MSYLFRLTIETQDSDSVSHTGTLSECIREVLSAIETQDCFEQILQVVAQIGETAEKLLMESGEAVTKYIDMDNSMSFIVRLEEVAEPAGSVGDILIMESDGRPGTIEAVAERNYVVRFNGEDQPRLVAFASPHWISPAPTGWVYYIRRDVGVDLGYFDYLKHLWEGDDEPTFNGSSRYYFGDEAVAHRVAQRLSAKYHQTEPIVGLMSAQPITYTVIPVESAAVEAE